jgi:hypothetical protein
VKIIEKPLLEVLFDNFLKQAQNNTVFYQIDKRWTGWDLNPRPQPLHISKLAAHE